MADKPFSEVGNYAVKVRRRVNAPVKEQVIEYMIAHREATNAEICREFGVKDRTITRARKEAIEKGYVGPNYFDRMSDEGREAGEAGSHGAEPLEKTLERVARGVKPGDTQLTTEESLLMLSQLARAAKRDGANKLSIEAMVAFHRLKSQSKEAKLGPNPPLSFDEKVERTSRVLEAAGKWAAKAAWSVAFPEKEAKPSLPYAFPQGPEENPSGEAAPEVQS